MATPTSLPATFVAGNVLTAAQMNALRGAFRILQVVTATYATQTGTTSATYATTGLTATITPSATSNKLLIACDMPCAIATVGTIGGLRLVQTIGGSDTTLGTWAYALGIEGGTTANMYGGRTILYEASPNTTSATTVTLHSARTAGAGAFYTNTASQTATLALFEVSA